MDKGIPKGVLISSAALLLSWHGDKALTVALEGLPPPGEGPGCVCLLELKFLLCQNCGLPGPRGDLFAPLPSW